jgi:uncharacterized protein YeaO (DUF488 family)
LLFNIKDRASLALEIGENLVQIKRAYEPSSKQDGYRVLIDRLWPRGIKKEKLALDAWMKELSPSTELRKEFGHKPELWDGFKKKYEKELKSPDAMESIRRLAKRAKRGRVTLLYSAHDESHNDAVVLKKIINREMTS